MAETWRRLNAEQRVAGIAAVLLIVSTFGPFSFVEAAIVVTALAVLALLKQRSERKEFHLPFGDGTVIVAAGLWAGLLILVRLFDRPLGQSVLALACAAILAAAGLRERTKRPMDDLPPPPVAPVPAATSRGEEPTARLGEEPADPGEEPTARLDEEPPDPGEEPTARLGEEPADQKR